jgi:hypothetical protein
MIDDECREDEDDDDDKKQKSTTMSGKGLNEDDD